MTQQTYRFVLATNDIDIPGQTPVRRQDVGIVTSSTPDGAIIDFIRINERVKLKNKDFEYFDVDRTGDQFPKKICNICHKLLDTSLFAKNQNGKNNRSVRRPSCGNCRKKLEGKHMTPVMRDMLGIRKPNKEPFVCPICHKRTIAGVTCKVVMDHDHMTGKPRAWICDSCNTGIGRFKDDPELLREAIKFLGK